jgi:hypothetical protein
MALEKVVKVDLIEVVESDHVQVRTKTAIMEDGKQISGSFHRHVVAPGNDYSQEDDRVKAICKAIYTKSVVDAYKATLQEV